MGIVEQLRSKLGEVEFEQKTNEKLEEFHHLIRKESAQYLLALEIIGAKAQALSIAEAMQKNSPAMLHARVERVFEPREFERGGKKSRAQRILLRDQSGGATLACFDTPSYAIEKEVVCSDLVEAGPVVFRKDEFHLMPHGQIKRVEKGERAKISDSALTGNFEGEITAVYGDFPYMGGQMRLGGGAEQLLMSAFEINDKSASIRVVKWDSGGISKLLKKGMQIEIENGIRKNGEIHVGKWSRLVFERLSEEHPKIEKIGIFEKKAVVEAGGKKIVFDDLRLAAIKFGIGQVPDAISPKTALELKKEYWIGKPLPEGWDSVA